MASHERDEEMDESNNVYESDLRTANGDDTESSENSSDYIPPFPPEQGRRTAAPNSHMINSDESDVGEQNQREDDIESEP
jgi:hypothetical protein